MSFRKVPELVRTDDAWALDPFVPTDASWRWPEYEGKIGYVYVFSCLEYLKIGMSNSYESRLKALDNACPFPIGLEAAVKVPLSGMALAEGFLHCKFVDRRHKNEWFKLSFKEVEPEIETAKRYAETFDRHCEQFYFRDMAKRGAPEYQAEMKAQHLLALKSAKSSALRRLEDIKADLLTHHPEYAAPHDGL